MRQSFGFGSINGSSIEHPRSAVTRQESLHHELSRLQSIELPPRQVVVSNSIRGEGLIDIRKSVVLSHAQPKVIVNGQIEPLVETTDVFDDFPAHDGRGKADEILPEHFAEHDAAGKRGRSNAERPTAFINQ
jgi:hypothetical protein